MSLLAPCLLSPLPNSGLKGESAQGPDPGGSSGMRRGFHQGALDTAWRQRSTCARSCGEPFRIGSRRQFPYRSGVVSFFHPPLNSQGANELLPPVLRPAVTAIPARPGDHVLIYLTTPTFTALIDAARQLSRPVIVYGFRNQIAAAHKMQADKSRTLFLDKSRARMV